TKQQRKSRRKDTELPQTSVPTSIADEAINEEIDDILERAVTIATSLDAELDRGGGPRCQEAMGDTVAQTRIKRLYKVGLSARVKSSEDEGFGEEDASKQGMIDDIDANKDITLVSTHDEQMFNADQDLVTTTAITTPTILIDEATLAQALAELKHVKPKAKAKGIVFYKPEESTITTTVAIPKPRSQDKGKAKLIEEPVKLKKKDQIQLDEEVALKL
nr:hypothetical protein [Tanacetum cinerariifolium]